MEEIETRNRPTFLTVICILSFIWIGLQILGAFSNIAMGPMAGDMMDMQQEQMDEAMEEIAESGSPAMGNFFEKIMSSAGAAVEHARTLGIISLISALLCLFGCIRMWNMKKSGFVPYVVGELGYPLASLMLVGSMGGLAILGFFFPILFVILYGVNLKHMS